jgi:hypothetical protein
MEHTGKFDETVDLYLSIGFWMYYISGDIGEFANIKIEVKH